jgi:beta-glucosidase
VSEGEIEEALIDEAVLRILTLKEKLGLFEKPYRGADVELEQQVVGHQDHLQVSRELATKSCVLLKNDNHILPLNTNKKIALIGPFADSGDILGPWSALGVKEEAVTLKQAFEKHLPIEQLNIVTGCHVEKISSQQLEKAVQAATSADVIVVAVGEDSDMSGEAGCRTNIQLPGPQLQLLRALATCGKPVITILFNGRPLDLHGVIEHSDAVLEAWYPGSEGGSAIVDLLYGITNPSGKLTMSFPDNVGQVPVYYNHFNTGRPQGAPDAQERYVSQYLDAPNEPLFPFGFGLSYTQFSYSDLELTSTQLTKDTDITATVTVSNIGSVTGEEIVQFYIQDVVGEVVRPLKELKSFQRISLKPGETKQVTFTITEQQLRYHHADLSFKSDKGSFVLYAGTNSKDVLSHSFQLISQGRN